MLFRRHRLLCNEAGLAAHLGMPLKLLLIHHGAIGDVLMCTPAIRALRKAFPQAEISFLVDEKASDALRHNPNMDELVIVKKGMPLKAYWGLFLKIFKYRYDIIIDFQRNPRSALVTLISGAKKRISFEGKHRNYAYNVRVPPPDINFYAGLRKLMLLQPLNIFETADCLPDMYITEEDRKWADELWTELGFGQNDFVIAISPVSIKPYRVWSADNFAHLCDHIMDKYDVNILFTWGPHEFHFIESILQKMKNKPNVDYRISSIKQLKALFEKCALFIGNDNGPRHIAITSDIPTVGIFSHIFSSHWTPPDDSRHIAIQPREPGIQNVELRTVIKPVDEVIESLTRERFPKS